MPDSKPRPTSSTTTFRCSVLFALVAGVGCHAGLAGQVNGGPPRSAVALEYFIPEEGKRADIRVATFSAELERHLFGGVWLRGSVGPVLTEGVFREDRDGAEIFLEGDGFGLGAAGHLRWRPIAIGPFAPFIEAAFGMFVTTEEFPPTGTSWNFNQRVGIGLEFRITPRFSLAGGYRSMHVSNGKGFGHPRNPSWDGGGVMLSLRVESRAR